MKEELIKRLLGKTIAEDVQGCSGLKLGAKTAKGVFNIKKELSDKKRDSYCNCISYHCGFAVATNGYYIIANLEDYAEIYEDTMVDYIKGEVLTGMRPTPSQYANVLKEASAARIIEVDDLLAAINKQEELYKSNPDLAQDISDGLAGLITFAYPKANVSHQGDKVWLNMKDCNFIKRFIQQCQKIGDCAVGVAPLQVGLIKIVGNGMMLMVNGGRYFEQEPQGVIDITNKVKPINK